jgi:ABC-type multidrug transport system ATPase subunit
MASLSGSVKTNGYTRDEDKFRNISAYVLQDDNLYAHLTVLETLQLAATFFMPPGTTDEERMILVEAVISELGLTHCRDTTIGDDKTRGVSGGERKRVCVGVQLISDPAVLFLDEPTSGLDSFQALSVMESMKELALNGRLVISVIHQPRSAIFCMFDRLLLLSEGCTMYSGVASEAVNYFASATSGGFVCQQYYNPSDFFLDILSPDNRNEQLEIESSNRILLLGDAWLKSASRLEKSISIDDLSKLVSGNEVRSVGTSGDIRKAYKNFTMLCWRAWSEQSRDWFTLLVKSFFLIFFALIIGGIYSNIGFDQLSIQNRNGFLFFVTINLAFSSLIGVLNTFPKEKNIVNRERSSRAYDTVSYFLAKFVVEIPLNLMPALFYCCIVYW